MSVETAGIAHQASLFSGPEELVQRGMTALAAVVVFVTVVAPFGKLLGTLYVLMGLQTARPPHHSAKVFVLVERLTPWSMIEVFVFGVLVAYVKLGDLVTIRSWRRHLRLVRPDIRHGVGGWRAGPASDLGCPGPIGLGRRNLARLAARQPAAGAIGCEACGLVSVPTHGHARCPRCDSALHPRKPDSIARTWALVIAAAVFYVPANLYPVLTVMQLGAGAPSTILGGVRELISSRMYPLAALVFFASIAVPMLKLVGLSVMLVATQTGHAGWLRDRTRLYHVVRWIGRWSMIDIFMEALLGALVRFGSVITIEPGIGAVAFCGVVILTMFAAETFDPRLMWDAAGSRIRGAVVQT